MNDRLYSYDEIPYESHAFIQTHPARVGAVARLLGVAAAPAERARVLELGCGEGWNVIASASSLPDAPHVGVDLGQIHIASGQAAILALGLQNIELLHGDFRTCPAGGEFDYIIAHGLFSWVAPAVADALLSRARALLAPGGVLYLSYNCLPGWHGRQSIRDAMRFRVRGIADGNTQVEVAREYIAFLASVAPPFEALYRARLQKEAQDLATEPSCYIRHDHLEEDNHPIYLRDLVARAGLAGLDYLGDSPLGAHPSFSLPPRVGGALASLGGDYIEFEQHTDFVLNRAFRRSLFVRSDTPRGLRFPSIDDAVVADLWVSSAARREGEACDNIFVWNDTRSERPPWSLARALDILAQQWPNAVRAGDLFDSVIGSARVRDVADERARFFVDVVNSVGQGLMEVATCPPRAARAGSHPLAAALPRHMIALGKRVVASLRHDSVPLEPADRFIASLADGTRSRADLLAAMVAAAADGGLTVPAGDTAAERSEALARDLESRLERLAAFALLEG